MTITGVIRTKNGRTFDVWGEPTVYEPHFHIDVEGEMVWSPGVVHFRSTPDQRTILYLNSIDSITIYDDIKQPTLQYSNGYTTAVVPHMNPHLIL
jgi:hypothetical protein